jgi:hypothetical protein
MLVQIWTNKFWTFQHVKGIPYSLNIMTSFLSRNISFSGYSRNCSVGTRSVFLTQYVCFNSINIFRSNRDVLDIPTPWRFRVSFVCWSGGLKFCNQSVQWCDEHFFRNFMQKTFWLRNVNLVSKLWSNSNHLCWKLFCRLLKMSWRQNC